jgi:DnaK suppressor protein
LAEVSVDLASMRKELQQQLHRLNGELSTLEKVREDARQEKDEYSGYGNQIAEAATETFEAERDLALIDNLEQMRGQVEAALQRIEAGSYGLCQTCGQPIPRERLEALPHADQCVGCKSKNH